MCGSGVVGVDDDDVALLEVFDEGVEVGEIKAATCVITALVRGESLSNEGEQGRWGVWDLRIPPRARGRQGRG